MRVSIQLASFHDEGMEEQEIDLPVGPRDFAREFWDWEEGERASFFSHLCRTSPYLLDEAAAEIVRNPQWDEDATEFMRSIFRGLRRRAQQ